MVDGIVAKQDATLLAIETINKLPTQITLEDEDAVIRARELYDLAAAVDNQKPLITNYSTLVSAESTILALKSLEDDDTSTPDSEQPDTEADTDIENEEKNENNGLVVAIVVVSSIGGVLLILLCIAVLLLVISAKTRMTIPMLIANTMLKRMQKRLLKSFEKQAKKLEKEQLKELKKAEKAEKKANKKSKKTSKKDVVIETEETKE